VAGPAAAIGDEELEIKLVLVCWFSVNGKN
jgi:hypothetical protein